MKAGLFLAALVQLASAQPRQNRHAHMHEKREVIVTTEIHTVTATSHNAVIYVNEQGQPYSTSYCTESPAQATPQTFTSVVPQAAPTHAPAAPAPAPAPAGGNHVHHGSSSGNSGHTHGGHSHNSGKTGLAALKSSTGMVWTPFNPDHSCKSADQAKSDFEQFQEIDYIRLYGSNKIKDCNAVGLVAPLAKALGKRLFLGVFDLTDVSGDINDMYAGLNHNWDLVDTVNIGNELVNGGSNSVEEVAQAVQQARTQLRGLGYSGPVVTVDTFIAYEDNPQLCEVSDYAATNAHAFYDPTVSSSGAGAWAKQTQKNVESKCGKPCIITESGWPHQGTANGDATPSPADQAAAISSLKQSFSSGGLILFTAFDELWKEDTADSHYAEKYWGIYSGQ